MPQAKFQPIMEGDPNKLTDHPLNAEIFPPLTLEEYQELKADIRERGIQDPLQVRRHNGQFQLLTGHHRKKIAIELGIKIPYILRTDFKEEWEIEEHLIKDNLFRRQLNAPGQVKAALKLEEIYPKRVGRPNKIIVENFPQFNGEKTRDIIAKKVGFGSGRQYEKAKKVYLEASKDIKKDWEKGILTTHGAYLKLNRETKERELIQPELPHDEFNIILADPPWRYDFSLTKNRKIENQYPTLKIEDICKLKPPIADSSIIYLWVPSPKLKDGIRVLESWGYEYKTSMVWIKDRIGMGYYTRGQHELILIGKRGTISPPEPSKRPPSVINAPRTKHSEKPLLHELLEKLYPNQKYLELFARTKHDNWEAWGNEI